MLFVFAFHLVSAMDCTFETAFQKGQEDIEAGSFGANVDRFCQFASDEARNQFPKFYELGRQFGPTLKKAEIRNTPKDQNELDALLKEAKLAISTKELMDRISKSEKTSKSENPDIQDLTKRIDALEAENKRLQEKISEESAKK